MRKAYALIYTMNSSVSSQPMALSEKDLTEGVKFLILFICIRSCRHLPPRVNGLERDYFAEENINGFLNYLTPAGQIEMEPALR